MWTDPGSSDTPKTRCNANSSRTCTAPTSSRTSSRKATSPSGGGKSASRWSSRCLGRAKSSAKCSRKANTPTVRLVVRRKAVIAHSLDFEADLARACRYHFLPETTGGSLCFRSRAGRANRAKGWGGFHHREARVSQHDTWVIGGRFSLPVPCAFPDWSCRPCDLRGGR